MDALVLPLTVAILAAHEGIQTPTVPDDVVIKLERTSCFGECPVYEVTIDARGNVTYEGRKFVRVEGRQTARIPVSRVAAILETADKIRFFDLRDQYRSVRNPDGTETFVTDLPTAFVSITRGGKSKRVEDYFGAPEGLRDLERQIDEAARTLQWIRIDARTLSELAAAGSPPSHGDMSEFMRMALQHDDVAVIKVLLELGADANHPYFATNTPPLMMARSATAARLLIEAGANPNAQNDNGGTPLSSAVYHPADLARVLLNAGARVDARSQSGTSTPLYQAACLGHVDLVELLLAAGADPTVSDSGGSAIDCARSARESERQPRVMSVSTWPFTRDFDRTILLLAQAVAKRGRR